MSVLRAAPKRASGAALAAPFLLLLAIPAAAQEGDVDLTVYDQAGRLVGKRFYDQSMNGVDWKAAREKHRPRNPDSQEQVHDAITALFAELRSSHTALVEEDVFERRINAEYRRELVQTWGVTLVALDEGLFVSHVLAGSAADAAGLLRGDRLVELDGERARIDRLRPLPYDSGLGGDRAYCLAMSAEVHLRMERFQGTAKGTYSLTLSPAPWNQIEATRASRRVIERHGLRLGYVHLYHVLVPDCVDLLREFLGSERLADADGLVLDLRGQGGLPEEVSRILDAFDRRARGGPLWGRPVVALVDSGTRSAKEIVAFHWLRLGIGPLVGQQTKGAVLGARLIPLRDGSRIMVPVTDVRAMTGGVTIERAGVKPHVKVDDDLPWSRGRDPILEAGLETLVDQALIARRRGKHHGWF